MHLESHIHVPADFFHLTILLKLPGTNDDVLISHNFTVFSAKLKKKKVHIIVHWIN